MREVVDALDGRAGPQLAPNPSYRVAEAAMVDSVHQLGMTISVHTLNTDA